LGGAATLNSSRETTVEIDVTDMHMKSLILTLAVAAATMAFPAQAQARDHWDDHRGRGHWEHHRAWVWYHGVRYVDPHHTGVPPHHDRRGRLLDSRGHRVNAYGRHLYY
jgi:Ni/Co efflux regulator RcnB